MLSKELEHCLNDAFQQARKSGHGQLTVEHLLLAILETPKVGEILRACGCDPEKLRQDLREHLDQTTPPRLEETEGRELPRLVEVQPTLGFQRVLQRAVFHVQSSGKKETGVANVLVAIFSEQQSHAVELLSRQNLTRLKVVEYISHHATPHPSTRIGSIVIHTPEFARTVAFWQAALGYVPREHAEADWVVLLDPTGTGPNLSFQARDTRPRSRSWVHLDLYATDQETELERLLNLGARRYPWRYPPNSDFIVLEDPGGNLFCLVGKPGEP
jgi:hypothetical protein